MCFFFGGTVFGGTFEHVFFGGTFFLSHDQRKEGSRWGGRILTGTGQRNRNIREQHLFQYVSGTRSRNTKGKPIAALPLW